MKRGPFFFWVLGRPLCRKLLLKEKAQLPSAVATLFVILIVIISRFFIQNIRNGLTTVSSPDG